MRNRSLSLVFFLVASLLCSTPLHAQRSKSDSKLYKWVDENGKVHYSTVIPPEENVNKIDLLKKNGLLIRHSDAQKTQEEILKEREEQTFLLENQKTQEEMMRRAKVLRERFKRIEDLESHQFKALFEIDKQIVSLKDKKSTLIERIQESKGGSASDTYQEQLLKDLSTVERYIATLEQQKAEESKRQLEDRSLWLKAQKR